MVVILTETEREIVKYVAGMRQYANTLGEVKNYQVGENDDLSIHILGFGGELAFCKAANIYPDLAVATNKTEWPLSDLRFHGGTWDIKTTVYEDGHLLSPASKGRKKSDFYALIVATDEVDEVPCHYRIVGWCSREMLFRTENKSERFKGAFALAQEQLHSFDIA